jgi:hypothetical protein
MPDKASSPEHPDGVFKPRASFAQSPLKHGFESRWGRQIVFVDLIRPPTARMKDF